ncbi:MAG: diguanylate cyclase [Succinivibrionaceae bacterium]|nr:diguanylate cyclase [Succinivibrionaceae bacterium]
MASVIADVLSKYYKNFLTAGSGDCYFLTVEDQSAFTSSADAFCEENNFKHVIRLQLVPEDSSDPLNMISSIFLSMAAEIDSVHPENVIANLALMNPDRKPIVDFITGGASEDLEYPLPDDITYRGQLYTRVFGELFNEIAKGSDPFIIFIANFQYATQAILQFFSSFAHQKKHPGNFLIFGSFVQVERGQHTDLDDCWAKWMWDMECRGKIVHVRKRLNRTTKIHWPVPAGSYAGASVAERLDLAQRLINLLCFREAYSVLNDVADKAAGSLTLPARIRLTLLLGRTQLFSGMHEDALVTFDRLNDLGQSHNDEKTLCLSNLELAYTNIFRGDFKSANRYITYSLKFAQNISKEPLALRTRFCEFFICDGSAVGFPFNRIKMLIDDLKVAGMMRELVYVMARTYSQEPFNPGVLTNDMCISYVDEAIEIAQKNNLPLEQAAAHHARGVISVKLGKIGEAITYFQMSEKIRTRLNIPSELAKIKNGIGYLFLLKEDFDNALDYFIGAMRTVINLSDVSEILSTLYNLAWCYFLVGENSGTLKVLNTLWEILKIKDTKYFPFKNIHDVFLLQGFAYFCQGHFVHAARAVQNSLNLDIDVSDQGSFMRPLLQAMLAQIYHEQNRSYEFVNEARLAWSKNQGQLSPLHELLFYSCLIYTYRGWDDQQAAYEALKKGAQLCYANGYRKYGIQKLLMSWEHRNVSFGVSPEIPTSELKQILYMIQQEQTMADLWKQVYGMKLCSILQKLTSDSDDLAYISSETLRLLCMHYNVQGGFVYLVSGKKSKNEMLASYSQLKNFIFSYEKFEKFIKSHFHSDQNIYSKVEIGSNNLLSSVILLPLRDSAKIIGHIVLTTYIGDFVTDAKEMDTIKFIANQLASKIVNLRQRDQLVILSTRDQLTGLKNRQSFTSTLKKIRKQSDCSLAFIDLDNFKHYNDTFGHEVGDKLLLWYSEILTSVENERIQVFRWGGDEFVVLFNDTRMQEAQDVMNHVKEVLKSKNGFVAELSRFLRRKISVEPSSYLDFSAGICYAEDVKNDLDDELMLQIADSCLYEVKRSGKARIVVAPYKEN